MYNVCFKGFITFTRNMEKKGIAGKGLIAQTVQERICKVDTVFLRVIKKKQTEEYGVVLMRVQMVLRGRKTTRHCSQFIYL